MTFTRDEAVTLVRGWLDEPIAHETINGATFAAVLYALRMAAGDPTDTEARELAERYRRSHEIRLNP